jgi:hypothetical protein
VASRYNKHFVEIFVKDNINGLGFLKHEDRNPYGKVMDEILHKYPQILAESFGSMLKLVL